LISSLATTVSDTIVAAIAATTATVATAVYIAAAANATVATTATIVATTAAIDTTVATTVVATTLLAAAMSVLGAPWLLLWGLAGVDCLAEHLKLSLDCQDVGSV
jgi:hypothetical protein